MSLEVHELTPPAPGAVAVLLVRGPGALDAVAGLCRAARPRVGALVRVELADASGPLDECLVVAIGARRVELHLHGSRPIVRRVVEALGSPDAHALDAVGPPGREGIATTLEARAWQALALAPSEAAARVLLDQAQGALRRELEGLLRGEDGALVEGALRLAGLGRRLRPLFEPVRVVLAGPVNAGKSTLFNALVGSERVLVSDRPGTTRDLVRSAALLGPYAIELVDTAGEREAQAGAAILDLEARGQALARQERGAAELVLWLDPADAPAPSAPLTAGERRVVLRSRTDLGPRSGSAGLAAGPDPQGARRVVEAHFLEALDLPADPWIPGRGVPFDALCREALDPHPCVGPAQVRARIRTLLADMGSA